MILKYISRFNCNRFNKNMMNLFLKTKFLIFKTKIKLLKKKMKNLISNKMNIIKCKFNTNF